MTTFDKWVAAIQNEEDLSLGSIRTLKMMKDAYDRAVSMRDRMGNSLATCHKYASDPSLDNPTQMADALKWVIEEAELALSPQ